MRSLIIILPLFFLGFSVNAQFSLNKNNIEYTGYTETSLKIYWENHPDEVDDFVGIYEPYDVDVSQLSYVLAIKKENDIYKIIMLGGQYGNTDVGKGGVKAIAQKMPAKGVFNVRWRMANSRFIENGFILKENTVITHTVTKYQSSSKYVQTYSPINQSSKNTSNTIVSEWKGNGSGVIISKSGYIVTNNHVIKDAENIEVEFNYKGEIKSFFATVAQTDVNNDLAIIKINDTRFDKLDTIPYNFQIKPTEVGTDVFALGYPMALSIMGKEIKFTDGKISSKTGFQGDITTYQSTTPIQPGNSGGPLFDYNGNLIGINSSGIRKDIADNVSYTIKTIYLLNLIDVLPEKITLPSSNILTSKPLTEQIKILSDYVVLVKIK
jgi:S1-C subfamily serine protease